MLNCKKKSKWLNAKIIVTQSWYNSIENFFLFYTLLFLVWDAILTDLFLFNFKTTHCKNHFDTNLVKIHKRLFSWLVGCFGLNGSLRQYYSLYRAVSQREGERKRNDRREKKCPNNPHPHRLQAQKALALL